MKKLFFAVLIMTFALPAFAADIWKMTGVMAVYPGTVNQPFSAPIVNDKEYASKELCDDAIIEIASNQPTMVMIKNGALLAPQKIADGYVAVAASCN